VALTGSVRARATQADVSFGLLGAALLGCAAVFATFGIPPLPPALLVVAGIPSPLTGMTRSFVATMQGDLPAAFDLHPLGPLTVAACAVAVLSLAALVVRGRRPGFVDAVLSPRIATVVAVAFALTWFRQIFAFN
jgi:hypothetical protein